MKKFPFIFLAMIMVISLASVGQAENRSYQLVGRELSPGILRSDGIYYGALFLGKIFDESYENEKGYFSVVLNRLDQGVEECGATTPILKFKIVMNFHNKSRLVLVMNQNQAEAAWDYYDPDCPGGCMFLGYDHYIEYLYGEGGPELCKCPGDCECPEECYECPGASLIALVEEFELKKKWPSWGIEAWGLSGAAISGWLVHTPLLIPAVFGTVELTY